MNEKIMQAAFIIGLIAAILLIIGYFPQFWATLRSRDTRSISVLMFLLVWFGCIAWIITGILFIVVDNLNAGLPLTISNVLIGIMSSVVFIIKYLNMRNAKKNNMSENDYYEKLVLPKLQVKKRARV